MYAEIFQYKPAQLRCNKRWYIEFYAFSPEESKLRRVTKKLDHIKKITLRREYANHVIKQLNMKLAAGWNPFVNPEAEKSYKKLSESITHYLNLATRKLNDGAIKEETYKDYSSYLKIFLNWIKDNYTDIYVYKLSKDIVINFLDYIYVELERSTTTRNNYLNNLRVFAGFLVEYSYTKNKFTDGVKNIKERRRKERDVISERDLKIIFNHLRETKPYFLLAAYVEYYMQIRPKEMSYIQLSWFNIAMATATVPEDVAKNRKTQTITLPDVVTKLMVELEVFSFPTHYYLFSDGFEPGPEYHREKHFRDYWLKMRQELDMPDSYKFYSLKDTGITHAIRETGDILAVRDQARHSSFAITNLYTPQDMKEANAKIKRLK